MSLLFCMIMPLAQDAEFTGADGRLSWLSAAGCLSRRYIPCSQIVIDIQS